MGAEEAPSGAIGTTGAGVALAAGPTGQAIGSAGIGAEISSGIGFDNGSPTFSGLERSDSSLGSFSINEGPVGPVSFTNSTDLFAETKSFTAPTFSVPEGPIRGDIFNQTEIIAQAPTQELTVNAEPVSIFDNTSPFQVENMFAQPEINVESTVESYLEISPETATQAVEDFKTQDPIAAYELDQDLKLAERVIEIAHEVTDTETAARISNSAIDTAVERSGIIESIEKAEEESEPEAEITAQTTYDQTETEPTFVRDGGANKARVDNRHQAAEEALKEADGEIVQGEDIIAKIAKTESEQSGLAKKTGVDDGSISPGDEVIKKGRIKTIQEADNLIYEAINSNSGVTEGTSGPRATDEEKAKVAGKKV